MKTLKNYLCLLCLFGPVSICLGQNINRARPLNKAIKLTIYYPGSTVEDSLMIFWSDKMQTVLTDPDYREFSSSKAGRQSDGTFHFEIPPGHNDYTYMVMRQLTRNKLRQDLNAISQNGDEGAEMLPYYVVRNGDSLLLSVNLKRQLAPARGYRHNFFYKFSGPGALTQNLRYAADSIAYNVVPGGFLNQDASYKLDNYENRIIPAVVKYLKAFKKQLQERDYNLLLAHAVFSAKKDEGFLMGHLDIKRFRQFDADQKRKFLQQYDSTFNALVRHFPSDFLALSKEYPEAEYQRHIIHAILSGTNNYRDTLYDEIKKSDSGLLRDQLLAIYFEKEGKGNPAAANYLSEAKSLMVTRDYTDYLNSLGYIPGAIAYNFDLPDTLGRKVRLSQFKGKIVFMDFWYTGCGNCLIFYKNELSKAEEHFKNDKEVVFVTISIDKLKEFWIKSIRAGNYTSGNATNLFTNGKGANSEIIRFYGINGYPQPMLIGKDQRIIASDESLRKYQNIIDKISKAKSN